MKNNQNNFIVNILEKKQFVEKNKYTLLKMYFKQRKLDFSFINNKENIRFSNFELFITGLIFKERIYKFIFIKNL